MLDHYHNNEHITTQKFTRLTAQNFAAKLKQVSLANKADIDDLVKNRF